MSAETIKIKELIAEDFIGSRFAGEIVRNKIEEFLAGHKTVVLDFEGITGITQSFGDEIIGLFVRVHGVDFVKRNISIINAGDEIKSVLNFVVKYSKPHHHSHKTAVSAVQCQI